MMKIAEPLRCMTRIAVKRHKILSAFYQTTALRFKDDKKVIVTDQDHQKITVIDKKKDDKVSKYEPSSDVTSPPSEDEELPNPWDQHNRVDNRPIPKQYVTNPVSREYSMKAKLIFDSLSSRKQNLKTFKLAKDIYIKKEGLYRRGHVEFIYEAMNRCKDYNLLTDLNAYKALIDVFPKEILKPRTFWEVEFRRYPKQQDCAIDVVDTMERHGVCPDKQFYDMVEAVFGPDSHPMRKLQRTMYWMPKFKHINPWPIPKTLPECKIELAKIALNRMAFDVNNELTVWLTKNKEEDPVEDTFIVNAQSSKQRELIQKLSTKKAVFVDGGYNVWLREYMQTYFVLRAEPEPEPEIKEDIDEEEDLFNWTTMFEEEKPTSLVPEKSVHEQEDGIVLAMCITGTSSRDSLVTWIRYLQESNPNLEQIPVVFTLKIEGQGTGLVQYGVKQSTAS